MVHQNPLVLDKEKRDQLENGGGSKAVTRAIRESIGNNFVVYCENAEKVYARDLHTAPSWWTPGKEEDKVVVRTMDQVASVNNSVILGYYAKNWIWEMQVIFFNVK